VRHLEGRFRTSITATVGIPAALVSAAESALWFGLPGGASAEVVTAAEEMAHALTAWFSWCAGVISAHTQGVERRKEDRLKISELTALIHDARAPLGVLRYLARDGLGGDSKDSLARELEYLDKILGQGGPRGVVEPPSVCEVGQVLARVIRRHEHEAGAGRISMERSYDDIGAALSELDLERIVTNLVSNALRHSPGCNVALGAESRNSRAVISVRDDGRGISRSNLEALNHDQPLVEGPTSGWRTGIRSCKAKLRSVGGDLKISSEPGEGALVEVFLPLVNLAPARASLSVADGGVIGCGCATADIVIIDDDQEHGESLKRLLERYGIQAHTFSAVDSFLGELSKSERAIILCDAHMPDGGAERLLGSLAGGSHAARVAVMSGDASDDYLYKVSALGAQAFFCKPVDLNEVCTWIREVQGMADRGDGIHGGKKLGCLVKSGLSV
jgi:signal transduction histidine kinase